MNARRLFLVAMTLGSCAAIAHATLDPPSAAPRVIRYISSLPAHRGQACYGVVLSAINGVPLRVRALSDRDAQLCRPDVEGESGAQLMRSAFAAADALQANYASAHLEEDLAQDRLAALVLPPVPINVAQLAELRRVVVGAGLNYAEHRDEVGAEGNAVELLVFPKPVAPTGPYAPVESGMRIGQVPPRPVLLLDYEVELGLVLLRDIDLRSPPSSYDDFIQQVAFFVANDVSDREPIILDDENGYTLGKSRPSHLPIGPWMVHGRHLRPRTRSEGDHVLRLGLEVHEAAPISVLTRGRQSAGTDEMLRGPWAIVQHMSRTLRRGTIVCMRDASGEPRFVHNAKGVIPAGSIILTGTPGGTAIREPSAAAQGGTVRPRWLQHLRREADLDQ